MLKKLVGLMAICCIGLTTFSANAELVHLNIYLDNAVADDGAGGPVFGLNSGFSGKIGTLTYESTNAAIDNSVTPVVGDGADPFLHWAITLGNSMFSEQDDLDYGLGGGVPYVQFSAAAAYDVVAMQSEMINLNGDYASIFFYKDFGSPSALDFVAYDINNNSLTGALKYVPEPPVMALVLFGLLAIRRFRKA